ncbi:MAG: HTH domain-containing protein [Euryarchaeota archaeon]|nr:HTH domain-containing protein [Euryarchaeota archaeon]
MARESDLLEHLRAGPKTARELMKLCGVSRRTLYKNVNRLVESGKAVVLPVRVRDQWTSLFALEQHAGLAMEISGYAPLRQPRGIEGRVHGTIQRLREKFLRNPTLEETALELGENPEDPGIREAIYRVGAKVDWRPPGTEERQRAEKELQKLLGVAAYVKRGSLKGGSEEIRRAQEYLKKFPDMVK